MSRPDRHRLPGVTVKILYFASFRESVGRDEEDRVVPEGTRVGDLWALLAAEFPGFASFRQAPPAAVNLEYVRPDRKLADGDEVAFLPPVAGG
jgi:molybdopterin converting factor subunit 1